MLCENCNERPATVHIVEILEGEKREVHLCEQCAHEKKISPAVNLSLNEILSSLMEAHAGTIAPELANVSCPGCGITYAEFRQGGRLGCARDYAVFRRGLVPFLERIHGATEHRGKVPHKMAHNSGRTAELLRLQRELKAAVENEQYEEAARLRDRISTLRKGRKGHGPEQTG